jgi:hypothetical protein
MSVSLRDIEFLRFQTPELEITNPNDQISNKLQIQKISIHKQNQTATKKLFGLFYY